MNILPRKVLQFGLVALAAISLASPLLAETFAVIPGQDIQAFIDRSSPGDTIILKSGDHQGQVVISHPLTLQGEQGSALTGPGKGSVITITSPYSTVRNLTIRGSGSDLVVFDSGVFVAKTAEGSVVENNRMEGNLYGIYLHGAPNAIARNNIVIGRKSGRMNDFGSGISVWNAPGAEILHNDISFGRDGIFVNTSKRNVFRGNRMRDTRFAVHYMYADDSELSDNISLNNIVGYAVMFSRNLVVRNNLSAGDRDHGLMLNYANYSEISGNVVLGSWQPAARWLNTGMQDGTEHGVPTSEREQPPSIGLSRVGPEKCVFIYNANRNNLTDNRFEGCEIGIHFTAGSEGNRMTGNAFINNRSQVKYVGTRHLDWSADGRGNYWSDNPAFDLDGDGIADTAYRPNGLVDRVLWVSPQAKVLMNSPAVQMIRWAQSQFPAILPGGVIDSHPLMAPPPQRQFAPEKSPAKVM